MILYRIGKKIAKLKRIAPEGKTAGGKLGMFFTTSVRHRPFPRGCSLRRNLPGIDIDGTAAL
jgi:hypothetical protein